MFSIYNKTALKRLTKVQSLILNNLLNSSCFNCITFSMEDIGMPPRRYYVACEGDVAQREYEESDPLA